MNKKNDYVIFHPSYGHFFRVFFISLSITMSFVYFFYQFVEHNPVLGFLELFGRWYHYLPFLIMLIKTSGFIIFLPMVYNQYSLHVKTDGLSGANSFIPHWSQRTFLSWDDIKHITYSDNLLYPAIFLFSKDFKKQIIVPMSIKKRTLFLEKIKLWSTQKSPAHIITVIMNNVEKK
jgi:hypothetical protein